MNAKKNQLIQLLNRILGTWLQARMVFLYLAGGAVPMILIGIYLIIGTNRMLVDQAKKAEMTELELLGSETEELLRTINTASKTFYFDEQLESIALKQYREYQEIVNDYRAYTAFEDFGNFYSRQISWISVYLDNDTISENAHFKKAGEETVKERWYQNAVERGGGASWQYMPQPLALDHSKTLALTRLLKTRKSQDVGVLVMYLRPERLKEQVNSRESCTRIVLNGEKEIASNQEGPKLSLIRPFLNACKKEGIFQKNIRIDRTEYVVTCYSCALGESDDILQMVSMKSYQDILHHANRQSLGSMLMFLVSVAVSVTLIVWFSRSFGNRVSRFRSQMQKAASGNFDLEPSLGGNDEISDLYGYLGRMICDIQRLLAEIYQERLHAEQLKTQQREAEFKVLASQINPHFLYNTLETIRMKARVNHQSEIEELVKMLAKILRKNIRAGDEDVSIRGEVEMVESYLRIQQYRFGDRIRYRIQVDEGLEECRILPLILQPIVENSIIHGLEEKEGIGHILIRVEQVGERIFITIEDDGLGISVSRLEEVNRQLGRRGINRSHIGICNVHQRIRLKYGEEYGLGISSVEGEMTRVTIRIPAIGLPCP